MCAFDPGMHVFHLKCNKIADSKSNPTWSFEILKKAVDQVKLEK